MSDDKTTFAPGYKVGTILRSRTGALYEVTKTGAWKRRRDLEIADRARRAA